MNRVTLVVEYLGWVDFILGELSWLVGRYGGYLLPKQGGGTCQIKGNPIKVLDHQSHTVVLSTILQRFNNPVPSLRLISLIGERRRVVMYVRTSILRSE